MVDYNPEQYNWINSTGVDAIGPDEEFSLPSPARDFNPDVPRDIELLNKNVSSYLKGLKGQVDTIEGNLSPDGDTDTTYEFVVEDGKLRLKGSDGAEYDVEITAGDSGKLTVTIDNDNNAIELDVDLSDYYTQSEVDNLIPDAVNLDNYYTKDEAYNKQEVDDLIPADNSKYTEHLKNGETNQILAKASEEEGHYIWKSFTLPDGQEPYPGISDEDGNEIQIRGDGLFVPEVARMIDADKAGTKDFGTTGPPIQLFGAWRPDGRQEGLDDPTSLITAPNGSTYTFSGTQPSGWKPMFGARQWMMVDQKWRVTSGAKNVTITKDDWNLRITRIENEFKIVVVGDMDETKPPPDFTLVFTEETERDNWGIDAGIIPVFRRLATPGDYVGSYIISPPGKTMMNINWLGSAGVSYFPKYKYSKTNSPALTRYENASQCMGQASAWSTRAHTGWPSTEITLSDTVYSNEELQQMEAKYLKDLEADNG